jgi:hypothetical protein
MLDGRDFHISVPKYRKVLLKYSLFGRGTFKLFDVTDVHHTLRVVPYMEQCFILLGFSVFVFGFLN